MDEGSIEVDVYREDNKLVFRITDNGVGMTEEQMSGLLSGRPVVKSGAGSGVAVRNVHDRIRLYYGEATVLNSQVSWKKAPRSGFGFPFNRSRRRASLMTDNKVNRGDIHSHRVVGSYIRTFWKKVAAISLESGNVG